MNETLRLGAIAGVRVGVNWSVLVILALLFAGLAFGRFPQLHPGRPFAAYVIAGLVAALAFLASLLAHELAHAVVARRAGVEVEGITLWMLGGMARMRGEAPDPRADLRIAGVGPLVSLVLGVAFGAVAWLIEVAGADGLVSAVFGWLALINVVLAVFNLVPAAPLDGGRLLRAILWRRTGDRSQAALTAAEAGRRFGFLLIAVGLVLVVLTPGIDGLWLALLGWFISTAAVAEGEHTRVHRALRDVAVSEVMSPWPSTVPGGLTVDELIEDHVLTHRYSSYPVVGDDGTLSGLVTLERLRSIPAGDRGQVTVGEVAHPLEEVVTARPTDRLADVVERMTGSASGRVLVLDDGDLVGVVTSTDVVRAVHVAELRDASRP